MKRTPTVVSLALLVLLALLGGHRLLDRAAVPVPDSGATATVPADSGVSDASLERFSAEERRAIMETLALIENGGPFPYAKDGSVFGNREGRLPQHASGYYREYTVATPNSPDRGARRIVAGEGGEIYYTRDHYGSFLQLK